MRWHGELYVNSDTKFYKAVILEGKMDMCFDEVNRQANFILLRLEREYARDLSSPDGLV